MYKLIKLNDDYCDEFDVQCFALILEANYIEWRKVIKSLKRN